MKVIHVPTALLAVFSIAAIVATAVAVNHYQHRPEPEPTVPLSQVTQAREAAYADSASKLKSLQTQLDASKAQTSIVTVQKTEACAALTRNKIASEACR